MAVVAEAVGYVQQQCELQEKCVYVVCTCYYFWSLDSECAAGIQHAASSLLTLL